MSGSGSARVVIVDASVLINLIHVNRLDLLSRLEGWEFVVPEQALEEISDPEQARMLAEAIRQGHLRIEPSTDPAELEIYADLKRVMGRGEAACLSMAQARHWMVACDERGRFFSEARLRLGEARILNASVIFRLSIRHGVIDVEDAGVIKSFCMGTDSR